MTRQSDMLMTQRALEKVRVVDLTQHSAGPYCTKLLAGFGAEVLKIERRPDGDPMRGRGPFFEDREGPERSIPFLWLNTGKKSVALNLEDGRGVDVLKKLIAKADVLVENFAPGEMAKLGLGFDTLSAINPRLVMTSISSFGQTGPYRDFAGEEITTYAMSGCMDLTGDPAREPLASGPASTQYTAAMWGYIATLAALFQREDGGGGRHIDVSIQESALDNIEMALAERLHLGQTAKRKNDKHPLVPWELFSCKDGQAAVIGGPMRHWLAAVDMFEEPRLRGTKFAHALGRIEHRAEFEELIRPWLSRHGKEEIFHMGQSRGLAFGYMASLEETRACPQHESRGFFVDVEHPEVGTHRHCGAPFHFSDTPWRSARAPRLGEHTRCVLGETLGYSADDLGLLHDAGVI